MSLLSKLVVGVATAYAVYKARGAKATPHTKTSGKTLRADAKTSKAPVKRRRAKSKPSTKTAKTA
jgi:hypothetical protein